jgi:hypothetical protein
MKASQRAWRIDMTASFGNGLRIRRGIASVSRRYRIGAKVGGEGGRAGLMLIAGALKAGNGMPIWTSVAFANWRTSWPNHPTAPSSLSLLRSSLQQSRGGCGRAPKSLHPRKSPRLPRNQRPRQPMTPPMTRQNRPPTMLPRMARPQATTLPKVRRPKATDRLIAVGRISDNAGRGAAVAAPRPLCFCHARLWAWEDVLTC